MKRYILSVVTGFGILILGGCKPSCDLGYEGNHCTTPVRNKYLGVFAGGQTCGAVSDTCTITITEITGDVTKVRIRNINGQGVNTTGTLTDDGSISIVNQNFAGATLNGSVTYTDKIRISYIITGSGVADSSCTWQQN
jgi:hypothetical protein